MKLANHIFVTVVLASISLCYFSLSAYGQGTRAAPNVNLEQKLGFSMPNAYLEKPNASWLYLPRRQQVLVFDTDETRVFALLDGTLLARWSSMKVNPDHPIKVLSSDESKLLTFHLFGKEADLWDVENGRLIAKLPRRKKSIDQVQWSADGRFFILHNSPIELEREHFVYASESGRIANKITTKEKSASTFHPRENSLLTAESFLGYRSDHLKLWNVESGQLVREFQLPYRERSVGTRYSPDGRHLLVTAGLRPIHILDADTGEPIKTIEFNGMLKFSPNGQFLLVGRNKFRGLRKHDEIWFEIYDAEEYNLKVELRTGKVGKHQVEMHQIIWRPDSKSIVSAGETYTNNYEAESWDVSNGKQMFLLSPLIAKRTRAFMESGYDYYDKLSFTGDSRFLITKGSVEVVGEKDRITDLIRVWDAETGAVVKQFDWGLGRMSFTSDNVYLYKTDNSARTISVYKLRFD